MTKQKPPPQVLAMILCDQVIRDANTGKSTIVGSFSAISAEKFPAMHRPLAIYIALTDGNGRYSGSLRFVVAETEQELMSANGEFVLNDPLQVAELHFVIPALPLPKEGKYRMDFVCDGEVLKSRWFLANLHKQGPQGQK